MKRQSKYQTVKNPDDFTIGLKKIVDDFYANSKCKICKTDKVSGKCLVKDSKPENKDYGNSGYL